MMEEEYEEEFEAGESIFLIEPSENIRKQDRINPILTTKIL